MKAPILITTYKDLGAYLRDSQKHPDNHIFLVGEPRNGKTTAVANTFPHEARFSGRVTVAQLYVEVYFHSGHPTIICDDLQLSSDMALFLKVLLESTELREVSWKIRSKIVEYDEDGVPFTIPKRFALKTRFIFICNALPPMSANWQAVLGRTKYFLFRPTIAEMLEYASTWVQDKDLLIALAELVLQNPDAVHLDLTAVSQAEVDKRNHDSTPQRHRGVLSDGLTIWERTLRSAVLRPGQTMALSRRDRLILRWKEQVPDPYETKVSFAFLCRMMGWYRTDLQPVLEDAIACGQVKEEAPDKREGRGQQPASAYVLVPDQKGKARPPSTML